MPNEAENVDESVGSGTSISNSDSGGATLSKAPTDFAARFTFGTSSLPAPNPPAEGSGPVGDFARITTIPPKPPAEDPGPVGDFARITTIPAETAAPGSQNSCSPTVIPLGGSPTAAPEVLPVESPVAATEVPRPPVSRPAHRGAAGSMSAAPEVQSAGATAGVANGPSSPVAQGLSTFPVDSVSFVACGMRDAFGSLFNSAEELVDSGELVDAVRAISKMVWSAGIIVSGSVALFSAWAIVVALVASVGAILLSTLWVGVVAMAGLLLVIGFTVTVATTVFVWLAAGLTCTGLSAWGVYACYNILFGSKEDGEQSGHSISASSSANSG